MQQQTNVAARPAYVLGDSGDELKRLISQADFFGDLTRQVFEMAGLKSGQRVLDVGCGAGDVSFLAAKMVGPGGTVIGVDKSPEAAGLASRRAAATGLKNVRFLVGDLSDLALDEPVDAVVGRLVLMYFADPAVVLRRLVTFLKPGGVVAFHEIDMGVAKSEPGCDIFETAVERIRQAFTRAGADIGAGLRLRRIFQEAGLPAPQMILGARAEGGPDSPIYDQVTQVTRTLLPLMERTGVATAAQVNLETLPARMRAEAVARDAVLVSPALVGAWTKVFSPSPFAGKTTAN